MFKIQKSIFSRSKVCNGEVDCPNEDDEFDCARSKGIIYQYGILHGSSLALLQYNKKY